MASEREETLARMANGIADFFIPYPEEEAIAGIAQHLKSFWTRRMRADLAGLASRDGALEPRVRAAVKRLEEAGGSPPAPTSAAARAV